jgi:P-type Ca2+ transporter type 2C
MVQSLEPADARGLTSQQVQSMRDLEGPNELPGQDRRTALSIALGVLKEPMLALLLIGGGIYLLLGNLEEALILLAFALLSIAITVIQETRTERVLDALRDLTSPRAMVIRNGQHCRIAGRDVVRGDIVILSEGDRVPADAFLVQAQDMETDESLLTGESVPVRKYANADTDPLLAPRPGGDGLPFVFSGSLIVRGTGICEVTATGIRSEIGKIGHALKDMEIEPPHLQTQTHRLVRLAAVAGLVVSLLVVLLYGLYRGGWLDAILAGIAVGMSMLPEEFPVVLTVFMAMGAWRISRARVLTRRASAIETLGAATVLCTDKTGTLTENRMSVSQFRLGDDRVLNMPEAPDGRIDAPFQALAWACKMASATDPFDPMEKALHAAASRMPEYAARTDATLAKTFGLTPDLLAMTNLWQSSGNHGKYQGFTKGSPEAIAGLCKLGITERQAVLKQVDAMASQGLRVLGVASAMFEGTDLPQTQTGLSFAFLGLVGLADPLRASVADAVAQCRSAGIRVIMITGDYPQTAMAIARQAGISANHMMTGADMDALEDTALAARLRDVTVFARIMPEQKLRIVEALKADHEIVAMTGDGVNDAPSLKSAHIGIAMGGRGTDVAREVSSLVLLDDDFGSIVHTIGLGRRIYDNLRKAIGFIFAVHVPIAGLALMPLVFGFPILFSPIHIAFLEMVIDPVCTLVFEAETAEKDVMTRKPRKRDEPLFSGPLIAWSLIQGMTVFSITATLFYVAVARGMADDEVRALVFFSLVVSIISLIFVNRSFSASIVEAIRRPNAALALVLLCVVIILSLSLLVTAIRHLFRFGPLHVDDLGLVFGAGLATLIVLELLKPIWRKQFRA